VRGPDGPARWWFCIREMITKKLRTGLLMCSISIKITLLLNPGRRGLASARQKVATRTATGGFWNVKRARHGQGSRWRRVCRPQRRLTSLVFGSAETPRRTNGTGHQSEKSRIADHRHQLSFELSERACTHTHPHNNANSYRSWNAHSPKRNLTTTVII